MRTQSAARWRTIFVALLCIAVLGGCGSRDEREEDNVSASELYESAKRSLNNGAYQRAVTVYRQLQSRYPFGRYTEQSQIELAYAYYKNFEPELATSTLNRFIRTYPTHPHVDYAYYLRGLVNFSRDRGLLARILPTETVGRDQEYARQAFGDFNELIQRFPDSRYSPDARERMVFLRDAMAGYELQVARYYFRRGAYVASANRAKNIVENFQATSHAGEALALMTQSYANLDLDNLSADSARVLGINYPEQAKVENDKNTWLDWLWPF